VRNLGISMSELAQKLGLSLAEISQSVKRGEKIAAADANNLVDE